MPGEIVEHQALAIGHAAVLRADRGILLAGDMLSDVLIPLLDPRRPDQAGAYKTALDRLGEAARRSMSWPPVTAPLPRVPRWRPAWPPILPTSTRCGEERNRPTRVWVKTRSPASTSRTWSRPDPRPDDLPASSRHGRHPLVARTPVAPRPGLAYTAVVADRGRGGWRESGMRLGPDREGRLCLDGLGVFGLDLCEDLVGSAVVMGPRRRTCR